MKSRVMCCQCARQIGTILFLVLKALQIFTDTISLLACALLCLSIAQSLLICNARVLQKK